MKPDIRTLRVDEAGAAGALLGRAFRDAPGYLAILGHLDEGRRAAAVARIKTGFAQAAARHLVADGAWVDGALAGASLVFPPDRWPPSLAVTWHAAAGCLAAGARAVPNFLRADGHMRRRHVREPHWYLFVLGVEPALQGRGVGGALLRRLAERADGDGLPCYLETDKEQNVRIYEGAGYDVLTDEAVATRPGFRMWTMRRPAKGAEIDTPRSGA